jgi:hypothetical protein
MRVRHQIGVLSAVADAFLIPDNHIGRRAAGSDRRGDDPAAGAGVEA